MTRKISYAIAISVLLLTGTVSSAEPADHVTSGSMEAAKALVETMGGNALAWQIISGSRGIMMYTLITKYHATEQTAYSVTNKMLVPAIQERLGDFKSRIAQIYARHFSAQDLITVNLFYESPAGKKWVALERPINDETVSAGRQWFHEIYSRILEDHKAELSQIGIGK